MNEHITYFPAKPGNDFHEEVRPEYHWRPDDVCESCKRLAICFTDGWGKAAFVPEELLVAHDVADVAEEVFTPCIVLMHPEGYLWAVRVLDKCQKFLANMKANRRWEKKRGTISAVHAGFPEVT